MKAFYWYNKAAEKDDPDGMGYLSRCYRIGYGTEKNEEKADYWKKRAREAEGGNPAEPSAEGKLTESS